MKGAAQTAPALRPDDAIERMPSLDWIETLILSMALYSPHRMTELETTVEDSDFATEQHRVLWRAVSDLYRRGETPNPYAAAQLLHERGQLELAPCSWLAELGNEVFDLDPAPYARQLRDASVRRDVLRRAYHTALETQVPSEQTAEVLARSVASFTELESRLNPEPLFLTNGQILAERGGINAYSGAEAVSKEVIPTPFPTLNELIPAGGFEPSDLVIIAGHTSQGKTALALNQMLETVKQGKTAAFVTLEMPRAQIYDRLVAMVAEVDSYRLRRRRASEDEERDRRERIRRAVDTLAKLPFHVAYAPGITTRTLAGELKKLKQTKALSLAIVDYLQLMGSGRRASNVTRAEEVSMISRDLKRIAGELQIPIIALSQFSREYAKEKREPRLSDLKESGGLEADSSVVLLIHFTKLWDLKKGESTGTCKLIIAKQRSGATSWLTLQFHAPTGRFTEENDTGEGSMYYD